MSGFAGFLFRHLKLLILKKDTIGILAEKMAAKRKDHPFLLFEKEQVTFGEFNRRANQRANLLASMGVGKGDVVTLMMENRTEFLETVVGVAKLGAVAALINTNLKGKGLAHCVKIGEGKKVIIGAECLAAFKEVQASEKLVAPEDILVDTRWETDTQPIKGSGDLNTLLKSASEANPARPDIRSPDLALYIYTSGTTGLPKASRITHARFFIAGNAMGLYSLGLSPKDVFFNALPLYHSNALIIAFSGAFQAGCSYALTRKFSASNFMKEAAQVGATVSIYIGEVLRYLYNSPPSEFDTKHKITRITGNGLRPDIWEGFQKRFGIQNIREFYASTEGNVATINMNNAVGSCGTPVLKRSDNTAVVKYDVETDDYAKDSNGRCIPCGPDEVGAMLGEISLLVPFAGYSNAKDTDKKILRGVFKDGDAFFKTGDLMKKDADGNCYFVDRIGDTFRWKGENVSTNEVGEILTHVDGVDVVNVYGVEVPGTDGRAGMAIVLMGEGKKFDPVQFYEFSESNLPVYARPLFLRIREEIDLTGTFKMRKVDMQKEGYDPGVVKEPMYFKNDTDGKYIPLDKKLYGELQAGKHRF